MKDDIVTIPFVAHESAMNRMERTNIRLWKIIIVLIVAWFLTVAGFVIYLSIPNEIVEEINTQDVEDITDSEIHQNIGE